MSVRKTARAPSLFLICLVLAPLPAATPWHGRAALRPGAVLVQLRQGMRQLDTALPHGARLEAHLGANLLNVRVPIGAEQAYSAPAQVRASLRPRRH